MFLKNTGHQPLKLTKTKYKRTNKTVVAKVRFVPTLLLGHPTCVVMINV